MEQFRAFSPKLGQSGQFHFPHNRPLRFLPVFRFLGTRSAANLSSGEQIKGNIKWVDDALNLYENMAKMRPFPSVIQFTELLSRLVNLKEYSAAICIFREMCSLGISRNDYTSSIAINCYCLSNRVDYGFSILGWVFKRGFAPDAITYTTLLKGLLRENMIREAQELFKKMVLEELCELNVVTCGTVIDGLCKVGSTALRVLEKGSVKPNINVYSMVINSLCKNKLIDPALKLFDEILD